MGIIGGKEIAHHWEQGCRTPHSWEDSKSINRCVWQEIVLNYLVKELARPGLRSSGSMLFVPRTRLASYGDRAFSNLAPRVWKSLPQSLRDTHDISHFQNSLKTHLFRLAFEHIWDFFLFWPGPAPMNAFTEKVRLTNAMFHYYYY